MQRLLNEADWDADAVRNDLRGYVADHMGEPDGVLIVDERCIFPSQTDRTAASAQIPAKQDRVRAGVPRSQKIPTAAGLETAQLW